MPIIFSDNFLQSSYSKLAIDLQNCYLLRLLCVKRRKQLTGLVFELQSDALNKDVRCPDLLRKSFVVAKKLGVEAIEGWLHHELNGYPNDDEIPNYREIYGLIKVWNPYRGWQPLNFKDTKLAERLSKIKIMQSIGKLVALLENKEGGELQVSFHQSIVNMLMNGMQVQLQPTLHVSTTEIVGIFDTVRNTVLEWALELEKKGVIGEGMTFSKKEQQAASQVTYQITNNIGSMQNSQFQQDSPRASQKLKVGTELSQIEALMAEMKNSMGQFGLNPDSESELKTEISTIEIQSKSPKPKLSIISESLKSIRSILKSATGSVAATFLTRVIDLMPI